MLKKMFLVMVLLGICGVLTCLAPQQSVFAHTSSTCGSVYWATDTESSFQYVGSNVAGKAVTYHWDLSIGSLRESGTGRFCGRAADTVCLTIPGNIGWYSIALHNEWYINGSFVNQKVTYYQVTGGTSQTFCSYSGGFSASIGQNVSLTGYMGTSSGNAAAGFQTLYDRMH